VITKKGRILVVSSEGDRRADVICLTLTTSKSRVTSAPEISSVKVLGGRWRITAFIGYWALGKKE
jgi:hypothetical protein